MRKASLLISFSLALQLFSAMAMADEATVAILHFKSLQEKYRESLQKSESKISEQLAQSQSLQIKSSDRPNAARFYLEDLENQLKKLSQQFQETRLRVEVLDRILFSAEKNYSGGSFRQFLGAELLQLAQRELLSPQADPRIWKFFIYQSIAIRELAPMQTEVAQFFETYMNYSSVSQPKTPQSFLEDFNYSNDRLVESVSQPTTGKDSIRPAGPNGSQGKVLQKLLPSSLPTI